MAETVTIRGVVEVPSALLRNDEIRHITKTLTFESAHDGLEVRGYREENGNFLLPKFYFVQFLLTRLRQYIRNEEPKGTVHQWRFNGELRKHQQDPRAGCVSTPRLAELIRSHKGVYATAPCGSGKTVTAIYCIAALGLRTLVVTPSETVRKQWIEQIRRFLPGVKVTEYSGKKKDLSGDVVVASLQMLSKYPINVDFPFYVLDEAHMAATAEYQKAMFHVNYKYSLALTATGDRLDGMGELFVWPMANIKVTLDTDQLPATVIYRQVDHDSSTAEALEGMDPVRVDQELVPIVYRNSKLVRWIDGAYRNGRKIMVISKSIVQLRLLRHVFCQIHPNAKTAIFTNEITVNGKIVKELKRTKKQRQDDEYYLKDPDAVVFSTVGKAGVGYDDPHKDALIIALPMQDPRQVIGRVQRKLPGKKPPVVLIPVDNIVQVRRRMLSAYNRTLEPLGDKCFLYNECSFYVNELPRGRYVRHKVKASVNNLYRHQEEGGGT